MAAFNRDSLRLRVLPARSIEETGLDPSLDGGFWSPHGATSPVKEPWIQAALKMPRADSPIRRDRHSVQPIIGSRLGKDRQSIEGQTRVCSKCQHKETARLVSTSDMEGEHGNNLSNPLHQSTTIRRRLRRGNGFDLDNGGSLEIIQESKIGQSENGDHDGISGGHLGWVTSSIVEEDIADASAEPMAGETSEYDSETAEFDDVCLKALDASDVEITPRTLRKTSVLQTPLDSESTYSVLSFAKSSATSPQTRLLEKEGNISGVEGVEVLGAFPLGSATSESSQKTFETRQSRDGADLRPDPQPMGVSPSSVSSKMDARSRWKHAVHSVKFINRLASNIRSASTDLIEDRAVDQMLQEQVSQDDAGGVGAAAFEGAKTMPRVRFKGRKGMEGLIVRQNRGFVTFIQDFYVTCLKLPIGHFLVGVLLAPLVLGLLFTPLYLLDIDGLSFDGVVPEDATAGPLVSAQQRFLAFLNIFLYALSLSTTFGGAPVAARSPFCLLVANMNTLLAQFLFVFLSGAVFARMSRPSYPIRCSKKAIIKTDDLLPVLGLEQQEKLKVFAVRLVLTGPSPCELVDAKICLTFRIFVTLPSGSVFCSTQDLEVVHPAVSYLRYGLMVRHIIDKKSPVYGHTMESLCEGDASFSLTVMGLERASMQPVFHLEDYFVCDNDVVWEGDYEDFIHTDGKGQRILDHSRIDLLKPMKAATRVSQAVTRMKNLSRERREGGEDKMRDGEPSRRFKQVGGVLWPRTWFAFRRHKLLKSMSSSFTRAAR